MPEPIATSLETLGRNLRARRLAYAQITGQPETLSAAAVRLGVTPKTLREMERGNLRVSLGKYYAAALLYGGVEGFEQLFKPPENTAQSLFEGWPGS